MEFLLKRPEFSRPAGGAVKIVVGELFRKLAKKDSLLGRKVKKIMDEGGLPPLWLASSLWISRIDEELNDEILILDGTPRRLKEAELLDEVLEFSGRPKAVAILINISAEESMKRLLKRARPDDTEARIKNRLAWYETEVIPALEYYRANNLLLEVNGEQSRKEVFKELESKLELYFK